MRVVALTGAGISVNAGIPAFDTSWRGMPVRDILTRDFANYYPDVYAEFYRDISRWLEKEPTKAHYALAEAGIPIVTQNIDMLHQKAGSNLVLELHGNLRHGVVLFGDDIKQWWEAVDLIGSATHLLVIGCSLYARPAGDLPAMAEQNGATVVFMNEDADRQAMEWISGHAWERDLPDLSLADPLKASRSRRSRNP